MARYLRGHQVILPSGRSLTVETFQSLGNILGGTDGSLRHVPPGRPSTTSTACAPTPSRRRRHLPRRHYLDRDLSIGTARTIRGRKPWITGEYQHDGLRTSNGAVWDHLIALMHGGPA